MLGKVREGSAAVGKEFSRPTRADRCCGQPGGASPHPSSALSGPRTRLQNAAELVYVDGLRQVVVEPGATSPLAVGVLPIAGDRYESKVGPLFSQSFGELVSVHDGKSYVENANLRLKLRGHL